MTSDTIFWSIVKIPNAIRNKFFNLLYRVVCGRSVKIDWRGIKIINPSRIVIGSDFSSGPGLWLQAVTSTSRLVIGDRVNFSDYVHIGALTEVVISSGCLLGSKVHITDHSHGHTHELFEQAKTPPNQRPLVSKGKVIIEENVWIGDGAVVLPGVRIGRGAVVGANSVVTKDVEPFTVVAGAPARKL